MVNAAAECGVGHLRRAWQAGGYIARRFQLSGCRIRSTRTSHIVHIVLPHSIPWRALVTTFRRIQPLNEFVLTNLIRLQLQQ